MTSDCRICLLLAFDTILSALTTILADTIMTAPSGAPNQLTPLWPLSNCNRKQVVRLWTVPQSHTAHFELDLHLRQVHARVVGLLHPSMHPYICMHSNTTPLVYMYTTVFMCTHEHVNISIASRACIGRYLATPHTQ